MENKSPVNELVDGLQVPQVGGFFDVIKSTQIG